MAYGFNIITPYDGKSADFNSLEGARDAIFLAGPCPRFDFGTDWRLDAFKTLERLNFKGTVITPTNPNYNKMESDFSYSADSALARQTAWEREAMSLASAIVFWIPRTSAQPGFTTNIEFGEWFRKTRVFVGWPDGAEKTRYLACKLAEVGKTRFTTLDSVLQAAVNSLDTPPTMWFTSDTHFGQQRTLELSRRPFPDVLSMDLEMISNWNKRVTMNDTVVHAGDFVDPESLEARLPYLLSILNFKSLIWVMGNYDRDHIDKIMPIVKSSGRDINIRIDDYRFTSESPKNSFVVVHEPNDFPIHASPDDIILFGHIHGRAFAKTNGFDLGTDYHHYAPISIDQVNWFANAMRYWDYNVKSPSANVVHDAKRST